MRQNFIAKTKKREIHLESATGWGGQEWVKRKVDQSQIEQTIEPSEEEKKYQKRGQMAEEKSLAREFKTIGA
jgi:hypothetical protein